ncbi:hypothetical protein NHX12_024097, partial [Muraenolepis orangiensis]
GEADSGAALARQSCPSPGRGGADNHKFLPLLALTWMSAVLTITDRRSTLFQVLFAVFDSVQDAVRCRMGGCKDDSENSLDSCKNRQVQIMLTLCPNVSYCRQPCGSVRYDATVAMCLPVACCQPPPHPSTMCPPGVPARVPAGIPSQPAPPHQPQPQPNCSDFHSLALINHNHSHHSSQSGGCVERRHSCECLIYLYKRAPVLVALTLIESGMMYEDAVQFIRLKRRGAFNSKQLLYLEKFRPKMRLRFKDANGGHNCCVQ